MMHFKRGTTGGCNTPPAAIGGVSEVKTTFFNSRSFTK